MFIVKTIEETKRLLQKHCKDYPLKTETIPVDEALNRVSAQTAYSTIDIPHFERSTVDGYAVMHEAVAFASAQSPVPLKFLGSVDMGKSTPYELDENSTVYVPTGGQLPKNTTAVVMIENTDTLDSEVLINKKVSKWENILLKRSDIAKDQPVIETNQVLTPPRIGALKAAGIKKVCVYKKLTALVLSTGDEITDSLPLKMGEILDINTHTVKHYLTEKHIDVVDTVVIKDDFDTFKTHITEGMHKYDLVIASGGSSVGEHDYTYHVMKAIGADIFVHGVNIKPGKPTVLAKYNQKLFVGLPGQPTSAYMVLQTFFPIIYHAIHQIQEPIITPYVEGVLTQNIASVGGRTTYRLVSLSQDTPYKVTPYHGKSGTISSLKDAYGYVILNAGEEGYQKGETVRVYKLGDL